MSGHRKSSTTEYDYLFVLLLIGDSGVGKSCLLIRFCENRFSEDTVNTIGVDFKMKTIKLDNKTIKLQLWDTAGQERFRTITKSYYRGAHGIIVVFDVTDRSTFTHIQSWLDEVTDHAPENVCILVVGNKADYPEENRQVKYGEAKKWCDKHETPLMYFETSAKDNNFGDVFSMFQIITRQVLEQRVKKDIINPQPLKRLSVSNNNNSNKSCCNII